MLEIKNLKASIDNKKILNSLNLSIKSGEVHAIMGPNGSGKSTLSNILSGKKGYEISGEIKFENDNLLFASDAERFSKKKNDPDIPKRYPKYPDDFGKEVNFHLSSNGDSDPQGGPTCFPLGSGILIFIGDKFCC